MTRAKVFAAVVGSVGLLTTWFLSKAAPQTPAYLPAVNPPKPPFTIVDPSAPLIRQASQQPAPMPGPAPAPAPQGHEPPCAPHSCGYACGHECNIVCFKPWKCEDLEMKPVEKKPCHACDCGWLHALLWCPPNEEEEKKENGNGNGNAKNGNGDDKTEGEKKAGKNGNGENGEEKKEEEAEEPEELTPLMAAIQCYHPGLYQHLDCNKAKVYGWIQQGFTANFDSPNNRNNFGVNFNNRSNDYMLNQLWLRLEKTLTHEKEFNWGYTVDLNAGQDAPDFSVLSIGMWENFTGDADTAIADDEDYGVDFTQFFVEAHFPCFITEKGMDVRVGRFLTLHGNELSPAIQTRFYSHSYGYFYAWPLSHTGVMTTLHLTDTVDWWNGLVVGWDNVFSDNNDKPSLHGQVLWTACDKKSSFWVAYTVGPEGIGRFDSANDDYRVLVTYDYTRKFGCYDEWELVLHGGNAWDTNLFTGQEVEWYDYAANIFYTIDPQLILGLRAEWFRDDDGYRTGFADSFYEVTAGLTYKPYQNLWVRPELRFDWADQTRPFNDLEDDNQVTAAVDVIWQF